MEERRTEDLYRRAEQQLSAVAGAVQHQDEIELGKLSELASAIADSVRRDDQLVVHALAGPSGPPLVTNLINVGILAAKVGAGLGYYGKELQRLVLAGLAHDIGLFAVPQSLVTKSGRLTNDERTLIEQHPELGYQVIRKAGAEWEWLAQVVRQAHERWNGQGYPNKLKGRHISELAQIIGVLDIFDALVTPRPYRRRFFPHEAVRELIVAERMAFPREIVKALVEQLSAYPLGTLVRLTTGEVGTVVRINTDFPLRPVVEIGKESGRGNGKDIRQLDLACAPLMSIIETLESPDIARMPFQADRSVERRALGGPSVSAQFASLLESLDAIANAIQGVVESRTAARVETDSPRGETASEPNHFDNSLQKEVVGLFALEAHEWLGQIYSALRRLSERSTVSMRSKLHGIMLQGLTNLAKSAAAVRLSAIEDLATDLLPVLHDVGREDSREIQAGLTSLQNGLDRIAVAVRQAAGGTDLPASLPVTVNEEVSQVPDPPSGGALSERKTVPSAPIQATTGVSLLNALRDLQQIRSRSMQPARDVLESVVQRAEQGAGELSVSGVRDILADLDRLDEQFLQEVRTRVPSMNRALELLRQQGATGISISSQLGPIVEQVEVLYDSATQVQAGSITMFLQGLRSFLLVAAYRKVADLSQRWEAVQGRIRSLIPMAEQWVVVGRIERAAISEILPG